MKKQSSCRSRESFGCFIVIIAAILLVLAIDFNLQTLKHFQTNHEESRGSQTTQRSADEFTNRISRSFSDEQAGVGLITLDDITMPVANVVQETKGADPEVVKQVTQIWTEIVAYRSDRSNWLEKFQQGKKVKHSDSLEGPVKPIMGNVLMLAVHDTCCWFWRKRKMGYTNIGYVVKKQLVDSKLELNQESRKHLKTYAELYDVILCLTRFECWDRTVYSEVEHLPLKTNRILFSTEVWATKSGFCRSLRRGLGIRDQDSEAKPTLNRTKLVDLINSFTFYCYVLPNQRAELLEDNEKALKSSETALQKYIVKPQSASAGRSIFVRNQVDVHKLSTSKQYLVQPYLNNPFLIDGRKFDMRIHVIVTNVLPLRAYLFPLSFARFAADVYDQSQKKGGKRSSYLTNVSVNNKIKSTDELTWQFSTLFRYFDDLFEKGQIPVSGREVYWRIRNAIIKVLLTTETAYERKYSNSGLPEGFRCRGCYQTLGIDVILDSDLMPHIIEVNGNPTMDFTAEKLNIDAVKFHKNLVKLLKPTPSTEPSTSVFLDRMLGMLGETSSASLQLRDDEVEYLIQLYEEQLNMLSMRQRFSQLYPPLLLAKEEETEWVEFLSKIRFRNPSRRLAFHNLLVDLEQKKVQNCLTTTSDELNHITGQKDCGLVFEEACSVFKDHALCKPPGNETL